MCHIPRISRCPKKSGSGGDQFFCGTTLHRSDTRDLPVEKPDHQTRDDIAIRYQIVGVFMITGATALVSTVVMRLVRKRCFGEGRKLILGPESN